MFGIVNKTYHFVVQIGNFTVNFADFVEDVTFNTTSANAVNALPEIILKPSSDTI